MARKIKTNTAIRKALRMDCKSFYEAYESQCFYEDVDNIMDLNDGFVNLEFDGTDEIAYLLFQDGKFECVSY